jgi:hypothetical protein
MKSLTGSKGNTDMRIVAEIMLDKQGDSPDADPSTVAEQADEEFLPAPGTRLFIPNENGESEFVVTSTRTWHEDMTPEMTERQMTAPDEPHPAYRTTTPQRSRR